MTEIIHKFTINRRLWLRNEGQANYTGTLLNSFNKLCCMGLCLRSLGAHDDELRPAFHPSDMGSAATSALRGRLSLHPAKLEAFNRLLMARTIRALIYTNDTNDQHLSAPMDRERALTEKFAEIGIAVDFTDDGPAAQQETCTKQETWRDRPSLL